MYATLKSYIIGFALSVALTLIAFFIVLNPRSFGITSNIVVIASILALGVIQLLVQLIFFLHLASETGPRWKLAAFISTVGIVLIVVIGAIWIMSHLNYNMMASPTQMDQYIQSQDGF